MDRLLARQNAKWTVTFDEIENANDFVLGLCSYFGEHTIQEIWGYDQQLADHICRKWNDAAYIKGNHIYHDHWNFYTGLDQGNRRLLISWYNKKMLE